MEKKKSILIMNASRDFAERMKTVFDSKQVESRSIRSRNCFLNIPEPGLIELFCENERIDLDNASAVFLRLRGGDPHFASIISKICQKRGIAINDPVLAENTESEEKVTQAVLFSLNNIPSPKTIVCTSESFVKNKELIMERLVFPCVLKKAGSQGKFVWKIEDADILLYRLFRYRELFVIQEYIPNSFDIRVLVYNNEILGAIKRSSTDEFYNNVSKGGSVGSIELTEEEKRLAIKSAAACGIDFAGVDIVRSDRGPLVFEVNSGPQINGFEGHTKINVPAEIATRMIAN
jgi:RimK family alpha-L-glutamate ligase